VKNIEILRAWANGEVVQMLIDDEWQDHNHHSYRTSTPAFHDAHTFRIKPKTININGYEVPEPCREPLNYGERYWCVCLDFGSFVLEHEWDGVAVDLELLEKGLIHKTKEAGTAHAKALLSFTTKEI
jgi:hypothetical protein